jgi:hypothetical protein
MTFVWEMSFKVWIQARSTPFAKVQPSIKKKNVEPVGYEAYALVAATMRPMSEKEATCCPISIIVNGSKNGHTLGWKHIVNLL